jgi:hypothetical protein
MAYSGTFKPRNPQKYIGDHRKIVYRSTWECRYMDWLDRNDDVMSWASEELIVPYVSPVDGKRHRYFPDFLVKIRTKDGKLKTLMVEIKPLKQSRPPEKRKRFTKQYITEVTTWGVNRAKWKAAIEYCKDRKWEFVVMASETGASFETLTENDLLLA